MVLLFYTQQLAGQRCPACAENFQTRATERAEKFGHAGLFAQRETQRRQPARERRFRVVVHSGDAAAGEVQHRQRFEYVVELRAGEIDVHVLAPAHAAEMLEISDAILVQDYSAYWQLACRRGFNGLATGLGDRRSRKRLVA